MKRETRFRAAFVAIALVGVVGTSVGFLSGFGPGITMFFGVVGIGGLAVLVGGETYVAPVLFVVGGFAAVIALVRMATDGIRSLGLVFAILSAVAFARGYQYYRTYST